MKNNEKIAVYTCIFGSYDNLEEIDEKVYERNVDYFCFTNNKDFHSKTWKIIYIEDFKLSNQLLSRKIKILGNEIINKKYDILVYMDGNICLKKKITDFIKDNCDLQQYCLWAFKHSDRNCIYEEAEACIQFGKETQDNVNKLLDFYKEQHYPKKYGLCEMGFFIRKGKDLRVDELINLWYEMVEKYSRRDQLSFMWCIYKSKVPLQVLDISIHNNDYFSIIPHRNHSKEKIQKYRLYFGNSSKFNSKYVVFGKYKNEKENTYIIDRIKIPCDTKRIEYEVAYFSGIEYKNIEIQVNAEKKIVEIELYNYYQLQNRMIFYNNSPVIVINGEFHKNDILFIAIQLKVLNKEELLKLAHDIELRLDNIIMNKNAELKNTIETSQKLQEKLEKEQKKYNKIINSKGWKLLEKARKIKNRMKL